MNTETKLIVSPTGPERQFKVSLPAESLCPPEVEWDDYYVGFSGYFGKHGPHVFAAAPEMAEALKWVDENAPQSKPSDTFTEVIFRRGSASYGEDHDVLKSVFDDGVVYGLWLAAEQARAALLKAGG